MSMTRKMKREMSRNRLKALLAPVRKQKAANYRTMYQYRSDKRE